MKTMLTRIREWMASRATTPGKSEHGAMHYFALFSRIFAPLAILGWLCWMPSPNRSLPKNWDPGCPEIKGTWGQYALDRSRRDLVDVRLSYLDGGRLLRVQHAVSIGQAGLGATQSRITILNAVTGAPLHETAWLPGQANYWPGIGLASAWHDASTKTFRLARWDLNTLTEAHVLILPEDHWDRELDDFEEETVFMPDFGMDTTQFKPAPQGEWQLLGMHKMSSGELNLRGLQLDVDGNFKSIAWESDPEQGIFSYWDSALLPFSFVTMDKDKKTIPLPVDPATGWPGDHKIGTTQIETTPPSITWTRSPRFGHVPVRLDEGANTRSEGDHQQRIRALVTAPLGVTKLPLPAGSPLLQANFLVGQLRTGTWRLLYRGMDLDAGLQATLRMENVRLVDAERGIDCEVDANTVRALRCQATYEWYHEDLASGSEDPRLDPSQVTYFEMPLQAIPLPGNRLLILHAVQDPPTNSTLVIERLRVGLVDRNQLAWIGWVGSDTAHDSMFGDDSDVTLARRGDQLLIFRARSRMDLNGGTNAPSTWITIPLPAELADLPEGPL